MEYMTSELLREYYTVPPDAYNKYMMGLGFL